MTAGRCCWPGQTWSTSARVCEGPPHCPAGWVGHGDDCVPEQVSAPPAARSAVASAPADGFDPTVTTADAWPSAAALPRDRQSNPRYVHEDLNPDIVIPGVTLWALGYLGSLAGAIAGFASGGSPSDWSTGIERNNSCYQAYGGVSLIPVVGAIAAIGVYAGCAATYYYDDGMGVRTARSASMASDNQPTYVILPIISSALEISGFIMTIVGLFAGRRVVHTDVLTARLDDRGTTLTLHVGSASLGLRLTF